MPQPLAIIAAGLLALGATEALAWWWMHPASVNRTQAVLCYQPQSSRSAGVPPASSSSSTDNRQPTTDNAFSFTPLPNLYTQAAPMLRCSSGRVFHVRSDEPIDLYLAYFEWDGTDTGSVLEAFRHMPEACLGSVGMTLIAKEPPISYQVGSETLTFDHTLFREPGPSGGLATLGGQGALVHAFRAVWVAGLADADARKGLAGDNFDRLRTIRLKSAWSRFRPAHARVVQGAVRGATTTAAAWHAFQSTMLVDLHMAEQIVDGR